MLHKCAIDKRFTAIGDAKRIWTVSAIHGEIEHLSHLHDQIFPYVRPGDRIVYTGNYMGYGLHSREVIDELLTFRRAILAKPGMVATDIVYLRGAQEEIWQKLLQLQFAPDPTNTFMWMLGNGLTNTLHSYDLCPHEGVESCRQGIVGLSKWTSLIREKFKSNAGHETFTTHLVRAAYTPTNGHYPMLFVNAGIDAGKPLEEQGDNFWWAYSKFETLENSYRPFEKIVRGYDPDHKGVYYNCIKATIDGGCGFGGELVCSVFAGDGEVLDTLAC